MKIFRNYQLPLWAVRLLNYEFWPFWVFYFPLYFYGIWLALRARSATYFTAVNPGMRHGGLVNVSKYDILRQLPPAYLPATVLVRPGTPLYQLEEELQAQGMAYPLVAKPNMGERGKQVEKIDTVGDLMRYLATADGDFLLQTFIDAPLELGVLFYRLPDASAQGISSLTIKGFLEVEGDGRHSLGELMRQNVRALFRWEYLQEKFSDQWSEILPKGKKILLEPIGNHNRGTTFLSGQHLVTPALVDVFAALAAHLPGYYYGRFDLKAQSMEQLYAGKFKVLELNGVISEPAHIYDPATSLWQAYRQAAWHAHLVWRISVQNHRRGVPYSKAWPLLREVWQYMRGK